MHCKTLHFLVAMLLFCHRARSQVISDQAAKEYSLKYVVSVRSGFSYVDIKNERVRGKFTSEGAGTLLSGNWVLTSARMVADHEEQVANENGQVEFYDYKYEASIIDLGSKNISAKLIRAVIKREDEKVHVHPYYVIDGKYDVALIDIRHVEIPFGMSFAITSANLLQPGLAPDADAKCVIQGWGYNKIVKGRDGKLKYQKTTPKVAKQATVSLLKSEVCDWTYNQGKVLQLFTSVKYKSSLHFCYGCKEGRCAPAPGDSGAPVVCALKKGGDPETNGWVVAVHSFGCLNEKRGCSPHTGSVGVDVRKVVQWIKDTKEGKTVGKYSYFNRWETYVLGTFWSVAAASAYFFM